MITYTRSHLPSPPWSGQQRCRGTPQIPARDITAHEEEKFKSLDSSKKLSVKWADRKIGVQLHWRIGQNVLVLKEGK